MPDGHDAAVVRVRCFSPHRMPTSPTTGPLSRFLAMFALVLGGEMIFSLPYHLPRYYRPTVLEVFGLTNAELGDAFVFYGITAMIGYFPGGILADHFSARKLMTMSLVATAAGGVYLLSLPGFAGLSVLYALWGVTSVFLFWGALIRATRSWGGQVSQGRGFGLLDGGRGLVAAAFASLGVMLLRSGLGNDPALADAGARAGALQSVISQYMIATLAAGIVAWLCIPDSSPTELEHGRNSWPAIRTVFGMRAVWLIAVIVTCAYVGYKGVDYYSGYAYDVLGMNEADAAGFTANASYIRLVAALGAGLLGDRFGIARMVWISFGALAGCWAILDLLDASPEILVIVYTNLVITYFGVYALRGLYFALLEQTRVPHTVTGAAVGLVSLIGYTPDIFVGPIAGRLIDNYPGVTGYQYFYLLLCVVSTIGLITAVAVSRGASRRARAESAAA